MEYTGYSKSDIEKMLSIIHNGEPYVTPCDEDPYHDYEEPYENPCENPYDEEPYEDTPYDQDEPYEDIYDIEEPYEDSPYDEEHPYYIFEKKHESNGDEHKYESNGDEHNESNEKSDIFQLVMKSIMTEDMVTFQKYINFLSEQEIQFLYDIMNQTPEKKEKRPQKETEKETKKSVFKKLSEYKRL